MAIHRNTLAITDGDAHRPNAPTSHVGPVAQTSKLDQTAVRVQARDALVGLGWKPAIARDAVDEAMSHVGRDAPIETIIREALRRCPRPLG